MTAEQQAEISFRSLKGSAGNASNDQKFVRSFSDVTWVYGYNP